MIPADRLAALKQMFTDDGIALTDAQALEIGLWLLARVRKTLKPAPLDRMATMAIIKAEVEASRAATPFVNLYDWRRKHRQ